MPFTLAHPSVVLPFKNKYFNLSALILGSMAPDFIYFILFSPSSNLGHTVNGFILLNLPMCFLINFLFFKYIKNTVIYSMPSVIYNKYAYITKYENNLNCKLDYIKFVYSALVGMLTHILWDAFTHKTGFFVTHLPVLNKSIEIFQTDIPVYKLLQHGSTVIGFLIIVIFIYNKRDKSNKKYIYKVNKASIYISLSVVFILTLLISITVFSKLGMYIGIGRLVVTVVNSVFISYLVTGIFLSHYLCR